MARAMSMPRGKGNMRGGPRPKAKKGTMKRLLSLLFKENKRLLLVVFVCIIISATTGVSSSLFLNKLLTYIDLGLSNGFDYVVKGLTALFITMGAVYGTSILCSLIQSRTMATVTQRFLHQIRTNVFDKMQALPIGKSTGVGCHCFLLLDE